MSNAINNQFKMTPGSKEVDTEGTFKMDSAVANMGTPTNYGTPMKKTEGERLSGSERRNKAEGINVKSPKIQAQYDKYKESGGKLSINQAARIGFASPKESKRRMKQANIPGSRGRDALKGV